MTNANNEGTELMTQAETYASVVREGDYEHKRKMLSNLTDEEFSEFMKTARVSTEGRDEQELEVVSFQIRGKTVEIKRDVNGHDTVFINGNALNDDVLAEELAKHYFIHGKGVKSMQDAATKTVRAEREAWEADRVVREARELLQ